MIKRKTKFVQSSFETEELGDRKGLMQGYKPGKGSGTYINDKFFDSYSLEDKIKSLQERMDYIVSPDNKDTKDNKKLQYEETKLIYEDLLKQKSAEQNKKDEEGRESVQNNNAKLNRDANLKQAYIEKDTKIETAHIQKDGQIAVAKIQQDPNQINQTEMDVFNIIKKYDFLKDPEAFKNLVNTTADNNIKSDALTLEKDLAKLGMHLKVDGKIDQNTIDAVEALISKNAPAIKAYEEITGVSPIKPSMGR